MSSTIVPDIVIPTPWQPLNLAMSSTFASQPRIAIASCERSGTNCFTVARLVGPSVVSDGVVPVAFPQTHVQFSPMGDDSGGGDLLLTAGDAIRTWRIESGTIVGTGTIHGSGTEDIFVAADWSSLDTNLVIAASCVGTVDILDISTQAKMSKVMAHDHGVHDVTFCGTSPTFLTAGFDGSVRYFDLRDLMSSYIYYKAAKPLMQVAVCPFDANKFVTFSRDSSTAVIIDGRRPETPCALIRHTGARITGAVWSKMVCDEVFTSDTTGRVMMSNVKIGEMNSESSVFYGAESCVQRLACGLGYLGMATNGKVELLKNTSPLAFGRGFMKMG